MELYFARFLRINHLDAELNPIRHLLALLGAHHILHVSRVRVKQNYSRLRLFKRQRFLLTIEI